MTTTRNVWLVAGVLGWVAACDGSQTPQPAGMPMQPPTMMSTPTPQLPTQTAGMAAPAQPPASAGTGASATAGAGGGAAGNDVAMPMGPTAGSGDAPMDACAERRVSYTTPCHTNPDPCGLASGWPGDEYCLLAPKPEEGVQIHIGPDDYKDMAEVGKYVLQKGEEFNNSVIGHIPFEGTRWYNRIKVQMRPGSHHWISSVVEGKPEEKFYDGTDCGATQIGSIGGGQNLIYDNPPGGIPAPENVGLGSQIRGDSSLCMNLHAYNFTESPQMREMWINLYFVDEAAVTQRSQGIGVVGGIGMAVPVGQKQTLTYEETFAAPGRIIQLFGHRHVWTPRFAVWLNEDLIYDSWSWQESVTFNYDSLTQNPPLSTEAKIDGAISGSIDVKAGDVLKFSCFIENDSDQVLRFRNELYAGEMCNLWGKAVGTGISGTHF